MTKEELQKLALSWMKFSGVECDPEDLVSHLLAPAIKEAVCRERKRLIGDNKNPEEPANCGTLERCASICEQIATNHWRRETYSHEQVAVALEQAADKIRDLKPLPNELEKELCQTCHKLDCSGAPRFKGMCPCDTSAPRGTSQHAFTKAS